MKSFLSDILFIDRSPEQYKEEYNTDEEFRELTEYGSGSVVFDDMLEF